MKKAVIYARVSSTNDRQDTGRQIKDLENYAKSQNIEIVKIYEEHISGAKRIEQIRHAAVTMRLEYYSKFLMFYRFCPLKSGSNLSWVMCIVIYNFYPFILITVKNIISSF